MQFKTKHPGLKTQKKIKKRFMLKQLLHEINKVKNGPDGALIEFKATINFQASDGEMMLLKPRWTFYVPG